MRDRSRPRPVRGHIARALSTLAVLVANAAVVACDSTSGSPSPLAGSASEGLVFVTSDFDLQRGRLSDGAVVPVTQTPGQIERWPYWSDAAQRLVFQAGPKRKRERLHLLDPRAASSEVLLALPSRFENWPVWSPDGTRIAYVFWGASKGPDGGLAVLELASRKRRVLTQNEQTRARRSIAIRPEWSPDGKHLVAQRNRRLYTELWLLASDGRSGSRITEVPPAGTHYVKARFTRDGRWIVFQQESEKPSDLFLIRPDGSDLRRFASVPESPDYSARPSPTRDEVVFVSERSGTADLYLASLPDGAVRRLTEDPNAFDQLPRWSPDGEFVAYSSDAASGLARVRVVDRRGRILFEAPGQMADWMPPWR